MISLSHTLMLFPEAYVSVNKLVIELGKSILKTRQPTSLENVHRSGPRTQTVLNVKLTVQLPMNESMSL